MPWAGLGCTFGALEWNPVGIIDDARFLTFFLFE